MERSRNKRIIIQKSSADIRRLMNELMALEKSTEGTRAESQITASHWLHEKSKHSKDPSTKYHKRFRKKRIQVSTVGVRASQLQFMMLVYYKGHDGKTTLTPSGEALLAEFKRSGLKSHSENIIIASLASLMAIQFPHPGSKTSNEIRVQFGKLVLRLLKDLRLEEKLYWDEFIYNIFFANNVDESSYDKLVSDILEYRLLSYEKKLSLFEDPASEAGLYANNVHELDFFSRIYDDLGILKIEYDPTERMSRSFVFYHPKRESTKQATPRKTFDKRKGAKYLVLTPLASSLLNEDDTVKRSDESSWSYLTTPSGQNDELLTDMQRNFFTESINKYLKILNLRVEPDSGKRRILERLSTASVAGGSGEEFERALESAFLYFFPGNGIERYGKSGQTDIKVRVKTANYQQPFNICVEAKSGGSGTQINPIRINRHREVNNADYSLIIAERLRTTISKDIGSFPICGLETKTFIDFLKSAKDPIEAFARLDDCARSNFGKLITRIP